MTLRGNEIKWVSYNKDGSIDCWEEREYDVFGNTLRVIRYLEDGSIDTERSYIHTCEYQQISVNGAADILQEENADENEKTEN